MIPAQRQTYAAVEALLKAVRDHVQERGLAQAISLLGQAREEFGGAVARWPALTDGDRQRVEHVRQHVAAVETEVMAAAHQPAAAGQELVAIVIAGLEKLRRDGFAITDVRLLDLARDVATAILMRFELRRLSNT